MTRVAENAIAVIKRNRWPIAISAGMCAVSLLVNLHDGSMLAEDDCAWYKMIRFGLETYPFNGRLLTTQSVLALTVGLGVSFRTAFAIVQYALMFALGVSSFHYLRSLEFNSRWSLAGMVALLASYPVLCAFHNPVYTREDIWSYLSLVLCFWALNRDRVLLAALALTFGMVAREATVVFWPVLVFGVLRKEGIPTKHKWATVLLPLALFGLYALGFHQLPDTERLNHFLRNFEDAERARDSIYSFVVSFGVLWLTLVFGLATRFARQVKDRRDELVALGALVAVPVTVFMSFNFGLARETRLFFPPFVFVIPIGLWFLRTSAPRLERLFREYRIVAAVSVLVALALGILLASWLFPEFQHRGWPAFARAYLGIHIGAALWLVFFKIQRVVARGEPGGASH